MAEKDFSREAKIIAAHVAAGKYTGAYAARILKSGNQQAIEALLAGDDLGDAVVAQMGAPLNPLATLESTFAAPPERPIDRDVELGLQADANIRARRAAAGGQP